MFLPPSASRSRPLFGISLAAHAALLGALAVPPLLATQEPPEPDGFVRILHVPMLTTDAPARQTVALLRKGDGGGAPSTPARATGARASVRPPIAPPRGVSELLPAPTGGQDDDLLIFEEAGERSEPEDGSGLGRPGGRDSGCDGCNAISATAPGVTPPVALESAAISYPELARRARVEGVVLLEAIIGADGSVRDVRVLQGAHPLLDPAALEAVRRWRYRPARIGVRPVAVFLKVVVTFSLRNL
ncbi:MAG TPA: energy transducer TonB [Thermoanaerobaculia bacterium]